MRILQMVRDECAGGLTRQDRATGCVGWKRPKQRPNQRTVFSPANPSKLLNSAMPSNLSLTTTYGHYWWLIHRVQPA